MDIRFVASALSGAEASGKLLPPSTGGSTRQRRPPAPSDQPVAEAAIWPSISSASDDEITIFLARITTN